MAHPSNRRRPRLVDRKFQLGLAWRMVIVFFLFSVCGLAVMFLPSLYLLSSQTRLSELEPAASEFLLLHERVWPAAIFIFAGVFVYALVLSHLIAGPIHRINETLRKMLNGEFPEKVPLRKNDYFHDTANLLEQLSRRLAGARADSGKSGSGDGPTPGK